MIHIQDIDKPALPNSVTDTGIAVFPNYELRIRN